jgi:MFS family permease
MEPSTENARQDARSLQSLVAIIIALVTGTGAIIIVSFSVFLVPISESLSLNRTETSIALSLLMWSSALIGPLIARMMDMYGVRRMLVPMTGLFGMATIALGLTSQNKWQLYALYLVIGAAAPTVVGYSKLLSGLFNRRRGIMLMTVPVCIAISAAIMPKLAHAMFTDFGWRGAYMGLGILVLAVATPATLLIKEAFVPVVATHYKSRSLFDSSLKSVLSDADFWRITFGLGLVTLALQGVETHLVPMLTERGISSTAAVAVFPALSIGTFAGQFASGYLLDRFNTPRIALIFSLVSLGGLVTLQHSTSLATAVPACILLAFGSLGEISMAPYLLSRYFGLRSFASIYAINFMASTIFFSLSPIVSGSIFDATGSYSKAFTLYSGVLAVAACLLLFLRRYSLSDGTETNSEPNIGQPEPSIVN